METDRMAALGFSVLMREWRRGMAFDPWHGSLYLKLSTVITLSPSFSVSLRYRWRNRRAPLDLIKSTQAHLAASSFSYQWDTPPVLKSIIADWSFSWKRKGKAKADLSKYYFISLELRNEHGLQSSCSNFTSRLSKPHKSLMVLQESLTAVAAWHQAKDDKPQDKFPSSSAWTMKVLNLNFGL